jgi:hypothetical protein
VFRILDENKDQLPDFGNARYVTPERGGELTYAGNIETSIAQNPNWAATSRRNNRFDDFRQLSVAEFRRLETLVLRKIEKDSATRGDHSFSFDTTLASINSLLDNVELVRGDSTGFEIKTKGKPDKRTAVSLSSGESELISLAIEILAFAYAVQPWRASARCLCNSNASLTRNMAGCFLFFIDPAFRRAGAVG